MDGPRDERVFRHPGRQPLLTLMKCQTLSASDTPEFDAQFGSEQTTARKSERRAFGVTVVVVSDAVPERLKLDRPPSSGGDLGAIPT